MNDFELESKLKAIRVPEKEDEYWDDFPRLVRSQLGRASLLERAQPRFLPQWAWNSGVTLACLTLILVLLPAFHAALLDGQALLRGAARLSAIDRPKDYQDEQALQQDAARVPRQLRVFMAEEYGMQHLVAERE